MYGMMSDGAEYLNSPEFKAIAKKIGATSVEDVLKFLGGKEFAQGAQAEIVKKLGSGVSTGAGVGGKVARFAASPMARNALRVVPGLTVLGTAMDAGDILTNPDKGNAFQDIVGLTTGALAGAATFGNPLAIATGASLGKMGVDALQSITGKSEEQRKMEEALKYLQSRGLA